MPEATLTEFLKLNMATMTTSHGLSSYITSCVKNPLDPKTGLIKTFQERCSGPYGLVATDKASLAVNDECFDDNQGEFFGRTTPALKSLDVENELDYLSDEQFYEKLQKLKTANRKTLEECEKLYSEKYGNGTTTTKEMVERMFAARLADRSVHAKSAATAEDHTDSRMNSDILDNVKDMSTKPPLAPGALTKRASLVQTMPTRSSCFPTYSTTGYRPRPRSAPSSTYLDRRYCSLDEEDWQRAVSDDGNYEDEDVQWEVKHMDGELKSPVSRIHDMWQDFRIDDYLPKEKQHSAAFVENKKEKQKKNATEEWRHRITVPKPFQMSLREETKTKKKTKSQIELEEKHLQKLREEEAECQKKFKAQPAPAHIYLPLYDEIREKNEARRRYVKQYCKEMMKSLEKPFNFMKREEVRKAYGIESARTAKKETIMKAAKKPKFVAKPVPQFMYDDTVKNKHLEDEEYRKIRIKMRAEEMLQSSSLPPNMTVQQKVRGKKELVKSKREGRGSQARRIKKVPDYDFLYQEFQKELARHRKEREGTVVKPFTLETEKLRSNREQVLLDIERDKKILTENQWPFQRSGTNPHSNLAGALSSSLDSIPCRTTISTELRAYSLKSKKDRESRLMETKQEEERRQKMREVKLRKYIAECGIQHKDNITNYQKKHKQSDHEQKERYEKYLEEMQKRVEKRPLLFEKETQISAEKAAEKKFKSTLRSAGIDEEFLQSQNIHVSTGRDREGSVGSQETNRSFAKVMEEQAAE